MCVYVCVCVCVLKKTFPGDNYRLYKRVISEEYILKSIS